MKDFVITEELLNSGLRGFPIGYCPTSDVDPYKGLSYIGKPIHELANHTPEDVIFLLLNRRHGSKEEVSAFAKELQTRGVLKEKTVDAIWKLPKEGHPMQLFCMAIELVGIFESVNNYKEDALNLIAKVPEIAAHVINLHEGWGRHASKPDLGYIENFVAMLGVPNKSKHLLEVMKLFNVLHYDHGGGNLSTFVGKAVASSLEGMYGSIASAMHALAGPKHGRANQDCLEFIEKLQGELAGKVNEASVETAIRDKLGRKELVFGFGHAVLRVEDARATVLYEVAQKRFPDHPLVKLAQLLRTAGVKVLKENPKISSPYPNVDAISGVVLTAAGFHYPECFTVLFGMARTVGIAAQIVYERIEAKVPIYRPDYIYIDLPQGNT